MSETGERVLRYLHNRMVEPSTYPALILVATSFGVGLSEDQKAAILTVGLFVAGLLGAVLPDRIKKQTRAEDAKPDDTA